MSIQKISVITGNSKQISFSEKQSKQTKETNKSITTNYKPYIVGGVAVTAATVLAIIGHKNGWASKVASKFGSNNKKVAKHIHPSETHKTPHISEQTLTETPKVEKEERIMDFLKSFDDKVEDIIRNINQQYPVINGINKGEARKSQKDIIEAFEKMVKNSAKKYKGSYNVVENTIIETRADGKKIIYEFEKRENGGLMKITESPDANSKLCAEIYFRPDLYIKLKNGTGIHHLDKIVFFDAKTKNIVQSISLNPDMKLRDFRNVIVYNTETGKPLLKFSRTAEPDHLHYRAELCDENLNNTIFILRKT